MRPLEIIGVCNQHAGARAEPLQASCCTACTQAGLTLPIIHHTQSSLVLVFDSQGLCPGRLPQVTVCCRHCDSSTVTAERVAPAHGSRSTKFLSFSRCGPLDSSGPMVHHRPGQHQYFTLLHPLSPGHDLWPLIFCPGAPNGHESDAGALLPRAAPSRVWRHAARLDVCVPIWFLVVTGSRAMACSLSRRWQP